MQNQTSQQPEQTNTPFWFALCILLSRIASPTSTSARIAPFDFANENAVTSSGQQNRRKIGAVVPYKEASSLSAKFLLTDFPGHLLGAILRYLIPRDIKSTLLTNKSLFKELKDSHTLDFLKREA